MTQKRGKIVIIDYGSGNLHSVRKACEHILTQNKDITADIVVSAVPEDIKTATHIILPGQGAFADCLAGLQAIPDLINHLEMAVLENKTPFLGICVGMQLMLSRGLEHGEHQGLGWIEGEVVKITPTDKALKIPHMGWNEITLTPQGQIHPVLKNLSAQADPHFYFVHSFVAECKDQNHMLACTDYGGEFCAIIGRDNIIGVQFHPEKSGENGLNLMRYFLQWETR